MTSNGITIIKNLIDNLEDRAYNDKNTKYYSLSDVYGPIKITENKETVIKVLDCLSFY